jgi:aminoglycoside phosphotransferase
MAIADDRGGPRLVGAFDLGCTGILDIHEDLFRLSLVSEALLDEVLRAYQGLSLAAHSLDRARIAIYYRAFLFYLMVGTTGERLDQLKGLLCTHLEYGATACGPQGQAGTRSRVRPV